MADLISGIRARHAAATRGPYLWWDSCSFRRLSSEFTGKDGDILHATVHRDGCPDIVGTEANKAFIAASWEDVRVLLAEVDRLRALVGYDDKAGE